MLISSKYKNVPLPLWCFIRGYLSSLRLLMKNNEMLKVMKDHVRAKYESTWKCGPRRRTKWIESIRVASSVYKHCTWQKGTCEERILENVIIMHMYIIIEWLNSSNASAANCGSMNIFFNCLAGRSGVHCSL